MTSPAEHAATVRELADLVVEAFDARDSILHAERLAELVVALAARADELERDLRAAWKANVNDLAIQYGEVVRAAEARADELERQLADARVLIDVEWPNQVEQLEARADELERERDEREVLLADAKDALAARISDTSGCTPDCGWIHGISDEHSAACERDRALLARIEELEGRP